jgi:hypothetical protein
MISIRMIIDMCVCIYACIGDGRELDDLSRPIVTPIQLPMKQKALQMAAGANHSMILGEGN